MTVGASEFDRRQGNLRQGKKVNEKDKTGVKYKCVNIIYEQEWKK
jgi:hypothetical protein